MGDDATGPSRGAGWDDLDDLYVALSRELEERAADHRDWLQAFVDAQAYRGRSGVLALARASRQAGKPPPPVSLRSHMDVAMAEAGLVVGDRSNRTRPGDQ